MRRLFDRFSLTSTDNDIAAGILLLLESTLVTVDLSLHSTPVSEDAVSEDAVSEDAVPHHQTVTLRVNLLTHVSGSVFSAGVAGKTFLLMLLQLLGRRHTDTVFGSGDIFGCPFLDSTAFVLF